MLPSQLVCEIPEEQIRIGTEGSLEEGENVLELKKKIKGGKRGKKEKTKFRVCTQWV